MSSEVKWIKITTDIFDDEKIKIIESFPKSDTFLVIWFKLLCLAGKQNNGGVFCLGNVPYTEKMFATIFGRPVSTVKKAFEIFEDFGMIERLDNTITVPNWEKHQSLDSCERRKEQNKLNQQKRREKQRLIAEKSSDMSSVRQQSVSDSCQQFVSNSCQQSVSNPSAKISNAEVDKEKDKEERNTYCRMYKESDDGGDKIEKWSGELGKGVVYLSENQFNSLLDILGLDGVNRYISKLADFIIGKNAVVKNHYETILKWYKEDSKVL